jgi:hypothetical protein
MAAASNYIKSPHPGTFSKGSMQAREINIAGTDVWTHLKFNGVPGNTQGAGWADIGSMGFDATTGIWYSNKGSKAVPNWVAFN